jgi:hypothetical protein
VLVGASVGTPAEVEVWLGVEDGVALGVSLGSMAIVGRGAL